MKVSFITVCYRTPDLIRNLLRGVEDAKFSFPYEYFLVDNGDDGTAEMVENLFPWVHVIKAGANLGFAKGNNLAIQKAQGEYIMLINPDLIVFPGEMEKLVTEADCQSDAAIFGPCLDTPNGTRQDTCTRFPSPLIPILNRTFLGKFSMGRRFLDHFHLRDVDMTHMLDVDSVYGAAMLIRRMALQKIGAFDERFFMYYEDVDLCRRAWKAGWRVVWIPQARFVHYHQRESSIRMPWEVLTNRLVRIHIKSAFQYFWKYRKEALPHRPHRS